MASLLDASCTCAPAWRGLGPRPLCRVHERAQRIVADAEAVLEVFAEPEPSAPWRPRSWTAAKKGGRAA